MKALCFKYLQFKERFCSTFLTFYLTTFNFFVATKLNRFQKHFFFFFIWDYLVIHELKWNISLTAGLWISIHFLPIRIQRFSLCGSGSSWFCLWIRIQLKQICERLPYEEFFLVKNTTQIRISIKIMELVQIYCKNCNKMLNNFLAFCFFLKFFPPGSGYAY